MSNIETTSPLSVTPMTFETALLTENSTQDAIDQIIFDCIKARKTKHIPIEDVAKRINASFDDIDMFESFGTHPTLEFIKRYTEAIGAHLICIKDDATTAKQPNQAGRSLEELVEYARLHQMHYIVQ